MNLQINHVNKVLAKANYRDILTRFELVAEEIEGLEDCYYIKKDRNRGLQNLIVSKENLLDKLNNVNNAAIYNSDKTAVLLEFVDGEKSSLTPQQELLIEIVKTLEAGYLGSRIWVMELLDENGIEDKMHEGKDEQWFAINKNVRTPEWILGQIKIILKEEEYFAMNTALNVARNYLDEAGIDYLTI